MLSDYNGIKPEANNKKIAGKSQNICLLKNTFLSNTHVKGEIKEYFELNENENITHQNCRRQ